jgi:hypothetical protein
MRKNDLGIVHTFEIGAYLPFLGVAGPDRNNIDARSMTLRSHMALGISPLLDLDLGSWSIVMDVETVLLVGMAG